jgi:UDP-glucose 4-epimerase
VLVTGADGFIGSHLVERLRTEGAHVRAFCFYNSQGSRGWLDDLPEDTSTEFRLGDIRDEALVAAACKGIEVVFHLAALIGVPYSYEAPRSFVDTNVGGTLNVLEAARRAECTRVVHTSTSEVYGTPAELPIREGHPLQAQSPYSASKIAADKLCEAYAATYGVPVVTLRPFNTYGPRQSLRAVIPTILAQLLTGTDEVRLGDVTPRRDLTFVADTVDGFVRAGDAPLRPGEVIQLGTGTAHSVQEIFDEACRAVGRRARLVRDEERVRPTASEVMILQSDPSKARERLGWTARTSLEEGLRATIAWLRRQDRDRVRHRAYHI